MTEGTQHLSDILIRAKKKNPQTWRNKHFAKPHPTRSHVMGAENFSAGWLAQGHKVCHIVLINILCISILTSSLEYTEA